jgi:hypothetical protein
MNFLFVSWIPFECGKGKKTRPLLPISYHSMSTSQLLYGISWKVDFLSVFKEIFSALFTPQFNYGARYDPFLGPVQTPVLPVMANIHTYDFCTSQFHSLSFTQLPHMVPSLRYLRLNFVTFSHLYHISHLPNHALFKHPKIIRWNVFIMKLSIMQLSSHSFYCYFLSLRFKFSSLTFGFTLNLCSCPVTATKHLILQVFPIR